MKDTHALGLRFGPDFDSLDDMPGIEEGEAVDSNYIWEDYDFDAVEFGGDWSTDSRICLEAAAPRPCTVLACVVSVKTNDRV